MWICKKCGCEVIMDFVQRVRCTAESLPKEFDSEKIKSNFNNIYHNYRKEYISFCCSKTDGTGVNCCWGDSIEDIAEWRD